METAEAITAAPTYGRPASSSKPCTVPSSPNVPCKTGNTTSISGLRVRLRQNRRAATIARLIDEVLRDFITRGIECRQDGFGRTEGDFMLPAAPAVNHGDSSSFHRIFFPIAGHDQFDCQIRRAVDLVDHGIHFHHFHGEHVAVDRRSIPWRDAPRDTWRRRARECPRRERTAGSTKSISSERWNPAVSSVAMRKASSHHRAQAAFVDIAHGEGAHARVAHIGRLQHIHIAQADEHDLRGINLGRETQQVRQFAAGPGPCSRPAACRVRCRWAMSRACSCRRARPPR